ncbi:MAG: DUF1588 domain-containing protein [Verrucomicrobiales bacterium]|nr:DUF1588 domain-containing protein [Verrucomicrobiales bacterium]
MVSSRRSSTSGHFRRCGWKPPLLFLIFLAAATANASTLIPEKPAALLNKYCLDCHDSDTKKGEVDLDIETIDWAAPHDLDMWESVLKVNVEGLMPPPKKPQPTEEEREIISKWLDKQLLNHTPVGGTLPRRLNQAEYQRTIRTLFSLPSFELPPGFPEDSEFHGFDNVGEGLLLSPPLLEAYSNMAREVADSIYPQPKPPAKSTKRSAGPEDLVISFSAATIKDGAMRLASRCETMMRSCTWPSRIEITASGIYRVTVETSTFKPKNDEAMILEVRARDIIASDRERAPKFPLLKEIPVTSETPDSVTFEAKLYEGQTLLFRWLNAEMDHEAKPLSTQMKAWFEKDPRFLAAWQHAVYPAGVKKGPRTTHLRGRNGWDIVKKHWNDPELDLSEATMDSLTTTKLLSVFNSTQGTFNLADALCHYYFENGPSLEIHSIAVEGPLEIIDGPKEIRCAALQKRLAESDKGDLSVEDYARQMLTHFLPQAFRRPVDKMTVEKYLEIAREHWSEGHTFEEGMHLLIRNILISPRFLYRALDEETMDDFDLATRLSYFLTQGPPDATLVDLAQRNRLNPSWVLRRESERLLPKKATHQFIKSFTGQWLDTDKLPEIMPDPKFNFTPYYIDLARKEIEYNFLEMIQKNRPMTDFIDPDFTHTSPLFAKNIYGFEVEGSDPKSGKAYRDFKRIELPRGSRTGGLLGQSAIMMATANGVDTQPVLRGVWMLENILGSPPPPPPKDVPALTPDTRGSTTPRDLLAAHTQDSSCASCHVKIDPIGFVLENYDPVGRWREKWPDSGIPIDPAGTLPDGTALKDVVDLKHWLVENIDEFSQCLAEKLIIYATGRVPNYTEKKEIEKIVIDNRVNGTNGFRDLIVALIDSKTFRTH